MVICFSPDASPKGSPLTASARYAAAERPDSLDAYGRDGPLKSAL